MEPKRNSFFHPASGMVILGVDWLCFGLEWQAGIVSLALTSIGAFAAVLLIVRRIQMRVAGDPQGKALLKALIGAAAAGAPLPIGGTVVGAAILAASGLSRLRDLNRR